MVVALSYRKKPYPRNSDIAEAIKEVMSRNPLIHPGDFVDYVKRLLEEKGFYTGLVTGKRIWRIYERMVKRGEIVDFLDVVKE